ncbi:MAG: DUF4230 domain-containing protein [Candidatus Eisenbacteria bacterium]
MEGFLIGLVVGLIVAGFFYVQVRRARSRAPSAPAVVVQSFITGARAVAELSVYRIRTKEIITTSDHWLGGFGKRYLSWLFSNKQMTMIFEFVIDFRYNLQSPEFTAAGDEREGWRVTLPPPSYDVQILNMLLHSEGKTELLPWLMPDIIGRFFTGGFSVEDKNRLIAEAKVEAARLASTLVDQYQGDARASARRTLEMMARGFGLEKIAVDFVPSREFRPEVDASPIEKAIPAAPSVGDEGP